MTAFLLRFALLGAGLCVACTTGHAKKNDAGAGDAAADAGSVDATPHVESGATEPVPVVSEQVDAGHLGDATANAVDGHAPPGTDSDLKTIIFNRLLVKAAAKDMAQGELQAFVEERTGQKLEKVRRTAGTFWLLQFAPTEPARTKAAQEALIAKLKETKAFAVVEADQVVTLKNP